MKTLNSFFSILLLTGVVFLWSCGESDSVNSQSDSPNTDNTKLPQESSNGNQEQAPPRSVDFEEEILNAKFIEFELGDASHYIFEDEYGKAWDFAGCEGPNCDFAMELPAEEADETNQGWSSNSKLQGKWFNLSYYATERELYIDGPVGTVYIISSAKIEG